MTQINAAKITRGSLWLTVSFIIGRLLQLTAQFILARLLSPQDFGVWAMILVVTNLSILFRDVAIAQVLVYKGLEDKKLVNTVYSLGVTVSVGLFLFQTLAGFPLSQFFGVPILQPLSACVALVFLIGAGAGSHGAVLQRQMQFKELAICDSAASLVRFGSILVCAILGWGTWSFAFGEVSMALVDSLLKRCFSRYRFTYYLIPEADAVREVGGFIGGLIGNNLAIYVTTNSDNLVIGRLLGAPALGYYNVAYQLAMMPVFALSQINRVTFSVLSQQDGEGKKLYVCQTLELYAIIFAPIYGLAFVTAPWLIPLLYGAEWVEAVILFQIVLVFAFTRGIMVILGTMLSALNKPNINAAINWALVPISVPSYWLGAWLGGTKGVAIAVAVVMGVGANLWIWLTTCRAAEWKVETLVEPIILPTVTMILTIATVLALPLPVHLQAYLQPIAILFIYGLALSVFSAGRIPQVLINLVKHSLNIERESAIKK